jgi:hypothetical protein
MRLKLRAPLRLKKSIDIRPGRKLTVDANKDAFVVYQSVSLPDGNIRTESTIFSRHEAQHLTECLKEWRDACIPESGCHPSIRHQSFNPDSH